MRKEHIKYIFTLIVTLIFFAKSNAQDLIVKKNGDDLNVKVLEINSLEVKYKITNDVDSTLKTMPKSDIFFIKYASGFKEVFGSTPTAAPSPTPSPSAKSYAPPVASINPATLPIYYENFQYFQQSYRIGENRVLNFFRLQRSPENLALLKNGISDRKTGSVITGFPGIPFTVLGGIILAAGLGTNTGTVAAVGGVMFATGVCCIIGGGQLRKSGKSKISIAIAQYNKNLSPQ